MATEGGADLRDVIRRSVYRWAIPAPCEDFDHPGIVADERADLIADAILGAIAEAGMVIVERGRLERLVALADIADDYCQSGITGEWTCRCAPLQPGDLDGPGGGEG